MCHLAYIEARELMSLSSVLVDSRVRKRKHSQCHTILPLRSRLLGEFKKRPERLEKCDSVYLFFFPKKRIGTGTVNERK